jgi:hypothetical protein
MKRPSWTLILVLLLSASPVPAIAQTALTPTISGNELTARIELPGGIAADLSVKFESVVGLNANALTLSANLVSPKDAILLSRLGSGISIPAGFPVVVKIEPTASSALAFEGVYNLSIYTHNLTLGANSPLRLYRSPAGGSFQDMTGYLQAGSVRAGGSGPGFSEFLIAADVRPIDAVIAGKFDVLQGQLSANSSAISPAVAADLQQRLNAARAAYNTGAIAAAIDGVNGFAGAVKSQGGDAIPNVWRANGGPVNVAGLLRSSADTLKYSLVFKSNLSPLP